MEKKFYLSKSYGVLLQKKKKKTIFLGLKVWKMLYFVIHIAKKTSVVILFLL